MEKLTKLSFFTVIGSTKTDNVTVTLTIELTGHISGTNQFNLVFHCFNRRLVYGEKSSFMFIFALGKSLIIN